MKIRRERPGATDFDYNPKDLARLYRNLPSAIVADLALLCFADTTTFDPDPRIDAKNTGRREVWIHINNYLRLSPEQIEEIFRGRGHVVLTEEEIING